MPPGAAIQKPLSGKTNVLDIVVRPAKQMVL